MKHLGPVLLLLSLATFSSGCNSQDASGTGGSAASAPVATSVTGLDSEEVNFLNLINAYRVANGAPPLQVSEALTNAAQWMSQDMATHNYLDHTDSLGRDPFTRVTAFGYTYSTDEGENVAAGNETGSDTFTQWKNSPEHNANMLDANYLVIGIGRAYDASSTYGWYWTTDFGGYVDKTLQTE